MDIPQKIPLLFCVLFFFSCVDNLDFNQIKDYKAKPVVTSSVLYFTIAPSQVFKPIGTPSITKETEFRVFDVEFIRNSLLKLDFNVEVKNEFDRGFSIQINFLDDNNVVTHKFSELKINAKDLKYFFKESVEVSDNANIVKTKRIKVTIKIENSATPLDLNDTSKFEFKSSAKFYINTDA